MIKRRWLKPDNVADMGDEVVDDVGMNNGGKKPVVGNDNLEEIKAISYLINEEFNALRSEE